MGNLIFYFKFSLLKALRSHPMHPLSYEIDIYILQNYIPLSDPHYIHSTKYILKVNKPMIYVMIANEAESCYDHENFRFSLCKCFLRKVMAAQEDSWFFNPVNLSFLQLVSYNKVFHAICNKETDWNIVLRKHKFFVFW